MRLALAALLLASSMARAADLVVLSRDGAVQLVAPSGEARELGRFDKPRALASAPGGRLAVLHAAALELYDGKSWKRAPGDYADAQDVVACGARTFIVIAGAHVLVTAELDVRTGKMKEVMQRDGRFRLFCGGEHLYYEHDGVVQPLLDAHYPASRPGWAVPGRHVRALAADGSIVYAATREGPLWRFDFSSGTQRDLGMGGWWGTLALAADAGSLFAVTQAGKLWHLDPEKRVKTIIAMSGWEAALAIAVSR